MEIVNELKSATAKTTQEKYDELMKKYQTVCFQAGQAQYQAGIYNDQVAELNITIRNLNLDGQELQKQLAKEKEETKDPVQ